MGQKLGLDLGYWQEKPENNIRHLTRVTKTIIMSKIFLLATFSFTLFSISCTLSKRYRTDDYGNVRDPNETFLGFGKGVKKTKIHSKTYPPSELTKGLVDFHKQFNQWPKSIYDLTGFSLEARNTINKMLESNFQKLDIGYSSPDSLVINYVYNPKLSKDGNADAIVFVDKSFPGKYIYIASKGDFLVENSPDKMRRGRK